MVLASDPEWLCGVDVAAPGQLHFATHLPLMERMQILRRCFSHSEVRRSISISEEPGVHPSQTVQNAQLPGSAGHAFRRCMSSTQRYVFCRTVAYMHMHGSL